MNGNDRILIVEDDKVTRAFLSAILAASDYKVIQAAAGKEGILMAASHNPGLILLDLGLPDMDGLDVLAAVREWLDIPIIIVTARQEESEKIKALDMGACDYVTKPFGNGELLARIRNALRLYRNVQKLRPTHQKTFSVQALFIDYDQHLVTMGGTPVHLTPNEYKIVVLLSMNAGKVLTHDYMIQKTWGPLFTADSQLLRVNMANIRRKLEPDPAHPHYIITEVGVGYRMIGAGE